MARFEASVMIACAAVIAAGCSGASVSPGTPVVGSAPANLRALGDVNLYVANSGAGKSPGTLNVYGLKRGRLLASITQGINDPSAVGYDAAANLLAVANRGPGKGRGSGSVALFAPGARSPRRILTGTSDPVALAFDASGKIYVANYRAGITIYKRGNSRPVFTIPFDAGSTYDGVYLPRSVAVDSADNVYVAEGPVPVGSQDSVFALAEFAPHATQPLYVLQTGGPPRAMIVVKDSLYLACAFSKKDKRNPDGFVDVYQVGQGSPRRTLHITQAVRTPDGLAVDAAGDLYVANLNGQDVGFYQPGQTGPRHVISNGVRSPKGLAIGPKGNLYVSNLYANTVTGYKPGEADPYLTIENAIAGPDSIALSAASP